MPHVRVEAFIQAEPAVVYTLFRNPETFPDFMPNVTSIEVVERGTDRSISHWVTDLDGAPLEWREADVYDDEQHVVFFQLVEGDVEQFEGRWAFLPHEGGTLSLCELDYSLGVPVLEEAVGPVLREKIEHNIHQMLSAVKERVEAASAGAVQEVPWARSSP
jgi:ribosome-associated toxin RatA of RatAB toxin-antitoxin module